MNRALQVSALTIPPFICWVAPLFSAWLPPFYGRGKGGSVRPPFYVTGKGVTMLHPFFWQACEQIGRAHV